MSPAMTDETTLKEETEPEYHCEVAGCDAQFPERQQAEQHIVEDHRFLTLVQDMIDERPSESE